MIYTLRPAEESDYDFMYQLKVVCLKEYIDATWGWDEEFQKTHFTEHFYPNKAQIVIVKSQDIGQLSVEVRGKSLFLAGIYILPAFQRRGIGKAILQDVLSGARSQQMPVWL
jgi:GNAT superfamily N-acetyltransferase